MRILAVIVAVASLAGAQASPSVVAKIRVGVHPCSAVEANGRLWVTNFVSNTVSVVDPVRNRVVGKPIKVDSEPCGIVAGAGSVWTHAYGGTRLDRIDVRTRKVTRIRIGHGSYDVLFAEGSVWVTNNTDDTVSRVDPATNRVVATIPLAGGPAGLAFAAGTVWVGTNGVDDDVVRIDPATNATTRIATGHIGPAWFSGSGDILWVSSVPEGTVSRLDPATGAVTATVEAGTQPADGTVAPDGLVWIPNLGDRTITRIDPASATVVGTMRVGPKPFVLAVAFADVWSPAWGGNKIWRIHAA